MVAAEDARKAAPALRWAIDTAATPGRWGDLWGDTHFANSLAGALRRLGQQVTVDRRDTRDRPDRAQDDVILVLRGLPIDAPKPGPVRLLWVISHPDEVTADEARRYDAVFAASPAWASERGREWGVPIAPLLQCTDVELCHPGRAGDPDGGGVLFIGNARRGAHRPIVDWAAAVTEVDIVGTGWEHTEHAGRLLATSVPNAEVGARYASAAVVLNDHWADMRRAGFVSNRLFDAVACGARVLSDPIDGAEALFGGSVVTCGSPGEVRTALSADPDSVWPQRSDRLAVAERVRAEHSFDRRAEALLERALAVRDGRDAQTRGWWARARRRLRRR